MPSDAILTEGEWNENFLAAITPGLFDLATRTGAARFIRAHDAALRAEVERLRASVPSDTGTPEGEAETIMSDWAPPSPDMDIQKPSVTGTESIHPPSPEPTPNMVSVSSKLGVPSPEPEGDAEVAGEDRDAGSETTAGGDTAVQLPSSSPAVRPERCPNPRCDDGVVLCSTANEEWLEPCRDPWHGSTS